MKKLLNGMKGRSGIFRGDPKRSKLPLASTLSNPDCNRVKYSWGVMTSGYNCICLELLPNMKIITGLQRDIIEMIRDFILYSLFHDNFIGISLLGPFFYQQLTNIFSARRLCQRWWQKRRHHGALKAAMHLAIARLFLQLFKTIES